MPVMANSAARLLRAAYRRAARTDRSLPAALPTSAVTYNRETPKQSAMPFDQFPVWQLALTKLPPLHQGYHRLMLLTGMRGYSAQRLRWSDVDFETMTFTLRGQSGRKIREDVSLPMTTAMVEALEPLRTSSGAQELIFPGAVKWSDPLPYVGHDLRHTYLSVAADLGVDELQRRLLTAHSLRGINQAYVTKAVLTGGSGLRGAQEQISKRIVTLLGAEL